MEKMVAVVQNRSVNELVFYMDSCCLKVEVFMTQLVLDKNPLS